MRLVCECHDLCHQQSMFYVPCHRQILKWITYEFCVIQNASIILYEISELLPDRVHLHTYISVCTMFLINHSIWLCHFAAVLQTSENVCLSNFGIWHGGNYVDGENRLIFAGFLIED